jgi:HNH endonuclease/AP2 domain
MSLSPKPVSERFWDHVAKSETCWLWTGRVDRGGYARVWSDGKNRTAHRVSYELHNGPIPEGLHVDHVCHNRACVRPEHLRAATGKQNQENRLGATRKSRSGVQGVWLRGDTGKWAAQIGHHGRRISLGSFTNLAEAEAAVIAKRLDLFTHNDADRVTTSRSK